MPADTNPAGDIFGGWLMSQMDLGAGSLAALSARGRAATIAVDGMRFHLPVKVGEEVSLFVNVIRPGRKSMHIHVTAGRRSRHEHVSQKVTFATFIFVALDHEGRQRPILNEGLLRPTTSLNPPAQASFSQPPGALMNVFVGTEFR